MKKTDSDSDDLYIVASELLPSVSKVLNWNFEIVDTIKGIIASMEITKYIFFYCWSFITGCTLEGTTYVHPIYRDKIHQFFNAAHVTSAKGTGLVHTAPAHGPDDFLVSLTNKIPIVSEEKYQC